MSVRVAPSPPRPLQPGGMRPVAARALVMLAAWSAIGCSPGLNWRLVPVAEPVTALFPCRVERRSRDGVPLAGQRVAMTQWSCSAQGMTFAVSHASLAAGQSSGPVLAAWAETAGSNLGARAEAGAGRTIRAVAGPPTASSSRAERRMAAACATRC
jgi:hypothetical protein